MNQDFRTQGAVLGGTLALQWLFGWLSDRVSCNLVITGAALASAASGIGVAWRHKRPCCLCRVWTAAVLTSGSICRFSRSRMTTFRRVGYLALDAGFFCSEALRLSLDNL